MGWVGGSGGVENWGGKMIVGQVPEEGEAGEEGTGEG